MANNIPASKPAKNTGVDDLRHYEIIRRPTTTKTNRERDNRIQLAGLASMLICMALVVSVCLNVYQSITFGGLVFYAQDIRTGELSDPVPVPRNEILAQTKIGPAPFFSETQLAQFDKDRKEKNAWLDGLFDDSIMSSQIAGINAFQGENASEKSTMEGPPGAQRRITPALAAQSLIAPAQPAAVGFLRVTPAPVAQVLISPAQPAGAGL